MLISIFDQKVIGGEVQKRVELVGYYSMMRLLLVRRFGLYGGSSWGACFIISTGGVFLFQPGILFNESRHREFI